MNIIKFNNQKFRVDLKDEVDQSIANEIFKYREYKSAEGFIQKTTKPILDVGAHMGLFSIYVRALNSDVEIIALEPEPDNFRRLIKTVEENNMEDIMVEPFALDVGTGGGKLVLSHDSQNHYLLRDDDAKGVPVINVKTISLGDLCNKYSINKIGLLKLDIEGGEFDLLNNWTQEDFELIDALIMEYHDTSVREHQDLVDLLQQNKFGVQVFPSQFEKSMGFILAKRKPIRLGK